MRVTWGVVRHKHATSALRHAHTFHQHPSHPNTLNSNAIAAGLYDIRSTWALACMPCSTGPADDSHIRPAEANFAARQRASRHIARQTGLAMALTARRRWVGRDKAGQAHALVAQPEADHHRGSQPVAPFASISVSCGRQRRMRARGPAMTLAAAPGAVSAQPASAPQWRVTLGNLAAGATAGVAVEAGRRAVLDMGF